MAVFSSFFIARVAGPEERNQLGKKKRIDEWFCFLSRGEWGSTGTLLLAKGTELACVCMYGMYVCMVVMLFLSCAAASTMQGRELLCPHAISSVVLASTRSSALSRPEV